MAGHLDRGVEHAGKKTSGSSMQTEVLAEPDSERERDILLPKRMFAASKEDISHAQNRSVPLSGSTDLDNVASESDLAKVGGSNPDVVIRSEKFQKEEKKPGLLNQPRADTSHHPVPTKQSSRASILGSGSSKPDSRSLAQPPTRMGSKGTLIGFQNSDVISSTIPEHALESASMATIEKAEKMEEEKARKATESPRRLRVAASTTNISQAPDEKSVLNLKRARSNTDVGSPSHRTTVKQPTHAKLKSRQSAPVGKANVAVKPKPRVTIASTRTSSGGRPHPSLAQTPGRLPPIQPQRGDPRRSSKESRLSSQGESPGSSVSTQPSSGSFGGKRNSSDQLGEGERWEHVC